MDSRTTTAWMKPVRAVALILLAGPAFVLAEDQATRPEHRPAGHQALFGPAPLYPAAPPMVLRLSPEDSLELDTNLLGMVEVANDGRYWGRTTKEVPRFVAPAPPQPAAQPVAHPATSLQVATGGGPGNVDWYAIARCESGGNWSINTGNGYWGGLQFAPQTWFSYGGGPFDGEGPFPYSAAEQIAVAERVLAGQGIRAWPYCGRFG